MYWYWLQAIMHFNQYIMNCVNCQYHTEFKQDVIWTQNITKCENRIVRCTCHKQMLFGWCFMTLLHAFILHQFMLEWPEFIYVVCYALLLLLCTCTITMSVWVFECVCVNMCSCVYVCVCVCVQIFVCVLMCVSLWAFA